MFKVNFQAKTVELDAPISVYDAAREAELISREIIAAKVNGTVVDLTTVIDSDCDVELLTFADADGAHVFRHTASHVLAAAVKRLYPEAKLTSGPAIERSGDLAAILTNLNDGDVLFIDEIHRLNRSVEEILYSAMEDYALDIIVGKGPSARNIRFTLNKFTLVGATTRVGMLAPPLRDRFGIINRLEIYTPDELQEIVTRSAKALNIAIETDAASEIARRSRGTPRIANRLLKRVRDFSLVNGNQAITREDARFALARLEIDELGLDQTDRNLLSALIEKFGGGPAGLETLAATTGEDANTIEDVYEPYLLQLGFIARTSRGRICLKGGYEHMGIEPSLKARKQISMFEEE